MPKKPDEQRIPIIYDPHDRSKRPKHEELEPFESVADVLKWEEELRKELFQEAGSGDRLNEIWFRGTRKHFPLVPGIYRSEITNLVDDPNRDWIFGCETPQDEASKLELKRLNFERDMILTFERESGPLLKYRSEQELYFLARHYGMPSRLLDWSISPMIALFMCVFQESKVPQRGEAETDGILYAMNPEMLDPPGYICHQHDPLVREAIEVVTRWDDQGDRTPGILPIRPHTLAARIDRQMSRFTLHCYGAGPQKNSSLRSRRVSKECKQRIRGQLERIGINQFTVYYTLDRLVSETIDRFSNPTPSAHSARGAG